MPTKLFSPNRPTKPVAFIFSQKNPPETRVVVFFLQTPFHQNPLHGLLHRSSPPAPPVPSSPSSPPATTPSPFLPNPTARVSPVTVPKPHPLPIPSNAVLLRATIDDAGCSIFPAASGSLADFPISSKSRDPRLPRRFSLPIPKTAAITDTPATSPVRLAIHAVERPTRSSSASPPPDATIPDRLASSTPGRSPVSPVFSGPDLHVRHRSPDTSPRAVSRFWRISSESSTPHPPSVSTGRLPSTARPSEQVSLPHGVQS